MINHLLSKVINLPFAVIGFGLFAFVGDVVYPVNAQEVRQFFALSESSKRLISPEYAMKDVPIVRFLLDDRKHQISVPDDQRFIFIRWPRAVKIKIWLGDDHFFKPIISNYDNSENTVGRIMSDYAEISGLSFEFEENPETANFWIYSPANFSGRLASSYIVDNLASATYFLDEQDGIFCFVTLQYQGSVIHKASITIFRSFKFLIGPYVYLDRNPNSDSFDNPEKCLKSAIIVGLGVRSAGWLPYGLDTSKYGKALRDLYILP